MKHCPSTMGSSQCELPIGHTTRHKNGTFSWTDRVVAEARETSPLFEIRRLTARAFDALGRQQEYEVRKNLTQILNIVDKL